MDVVVDMVLAEAVVARAARAVAELQIGVLGVCPSADGALVVIELVALLTADARRFAAEVHRLRARALRDAAQQLAAAEQQKAQAN